MKKKPNWKPRITSGWEWETLEAKARAQLQLTPTERYRRARPRLSHPKGARQRKQTA